MPADPASIGWVIPFLAGTVSFLSPCVIPLVPGYLSYVTGITSEGLQAGGAVRTSRVFWQSLLFVLGFTVVFVALGASASAVGALLGGYRFILNRISGAFIIVMGLYLLGVLRIGLVARERRFRLEGMKGGFLGPALLGAAFAFAWTPCIGPILASILLYAGAVGTVKTGALLLLVYALGLGLPFILTGLAFTRAVGALRWLQRLSRPLEAVSGLTLAAVGTLLITNKMFYVSIWAQRAFARFGLDLWRFF
ncbi:MAG: cytochrome c biogenesis CcdA family protein [bacterium]